MQKENKATILMNIYVFPLELSDEEKNLFSIYSLIVICLLNNWIVFCKILIRKRSLYLILYRNHHHTILIYKTRKTLMFARSDPELKVTYVYSKYLMSLDFFVPFFRMQKILRITEVILQRSVTILYNQESLALHFWKEAKVH